MLIGNIFKINENYFYKTIANEITELNLQLDNQKTLNEQVFFYFYIRNIKLKQSTYEKNKVNREYQDFKNKAEIEKQKLKKEVNTSQIE